MGSFWYTEKSKHESIVDSFEMLTRRSSSLGFYPCSQRLCDRYFRNKRNADRHFCWNSVHVRYSKSFSQYRNDF